ncbi:hypothetical protein B0J13DRAFT_198007 [Dactylonectria estremocensis]|uniref:Uncharacterized protein n=1 Tax=Dactylonectria estremocensis TaxID=1079267 RepID=A0A9P9DF15_9HYPO|nr:hypothetical protein B0J13DRAFT_198007 [Dactylonectria estremocensis]
MWLSKSIAMLTLPNIICDCVLHCASDSLVTDMSRSRIWLNAPGEDALGLAICRSRGSRSELGSLLELFVHNFSTTGTRHTRKSWAPKTFERIYQFIELAIMANVSISMMVLIFVNRPEMLDAMSIHSTTIQHRKHPCGCQDECEGPRSECNLSWAPRTTNTQALSIVRIAPSQDMHLPL